MNVSKEEFDAYRLDSSSSIERLHCDVKSSYASIISFMNNLQAHFDDKFKQFDDKFKHFDHKLNTLETKFDQRFDTLETKTDRIEKRLNLLADDVSLLRSNLGGRFDANSVQLRLIDQEQLRIAERQSTLEKRVNVLEDKINDKER